MSEPDNRGYGVTRRLFFVLPDVETSRKVEEELLLARIEEKRMHFLGKRGTDMKDLPVATHAQKTGLIRGLFIGLLAGALTGALAGMYIYLNPDAVGMQVQPYIIFICAVVGAIAGAWISGPLIGASAPNAELEEYQQALQKGRILLMVDVPAKRVEEIRKIVKNLCPEAEEHGSQQTSPAFP